MESKASGVASIGVIFVTHTARHHLARCLPPFLESPLKPRVLVVNSSSGDGTVELAQQMGAETLVVPRREFNHGATRELARKHLGTDIVVMVTPDAYAADSGFLERLVRPLLDGSADIAYARQLPHDGADFFEAFPRAFNYPAEGHTRTIAELERWGVFTFFCSNSCAAWRNAALDRVGGFRPVLTNEDYFATARILQDGGRIAYVAEAAIQHSHRYNLKQEFTRFFDTGYVRRMNPWADNLAGAAEKRGTKFASAFLGEIARRRWWMLPYAVAQLAAKWLGYRVGYWTARFPIGWCRWLSGQDYYWTSVWAEKERSERTSA